jgi:hypothetical protein
MGGGSEAVLLSSAPLIELDKGSTTSTHGALICSTYRA